MCSALSRLLNRVVQVVEVGRHGSARLRIREFTGLHPVTGY